MLRRHRNTTPFAPTNLAGLSLWLNADAGTTTEAEQFVNQIVLTGAIPSESSGTYTRSSGGNTNFTGPNGNYIEYVEGGVEEDYYFVLYDNELGDYTFTILINAQGDDIVSIEQRDPSYSYESYSSTTSLTGNLIVTSWADQSGNGNNANSNDSASKPLFSSSSINSKPAVLFRNSSWMVTPANSIGSDGNVTIFVALRNNVEESETKFLLKKGDSEIYENDVWGFSLVEGFGFLNVEAEAWSFSQYILPDLTSILTAISTNGQSSVFRNGISVGTPSTTTSVLANSTSLSIGIGASNNGSYGGIDADIAEIIIYSRTLTTPERQEVEAYLNSKYSIY
jgi:hypothetical protein